ncbi:hypothetical protein [Stutzerimonas nitrititolerans]|uniref:hypothetical protein n=1 Tax=Stutzerimonas nitrititolerans TaxID=2482751 RepID=UPI00289AF4A8|nr:hypothetical protein [Stutzerimonas nitrititolerans]
MTPNERKEILADLKSEYLYIIIPFILLILVKLHFSSWEEIILSPDWSLVSAIIFGQITSRISRAIANSSAKASSSQFSWYTAKRFLFVVLALASYFGMLTKPTEELGVVQLLIFAAASFLHFRDGFTTKMINKH